MEKEEGSLLHPRKCKIKRLETYKILYLKKDFIFNRSRFIFVETFLPDGFSFPLLFLMDDLSARAKVVGKEIPEKTDPKDKTAADSPVLK